MGRLGWTEITLLAGIVLLMLAGQRVAASVHRRGRPTRRSGTDADLLETARPEPSLEVSSIADET